MNVVRRATMTVDQFLAWEERQEERFEFNGVEAVLMTGGTQSHSLIQANVIVALGTRLRGKRCRVVGSDLKVRVAGRIRYPDAFVFCTRGEDGRKVVTDPVIVFEVLSPSTEDVDLFEKNAEYRASDSVRRYIILQQSSVSALVFARAPDGSWPSTVLTGSDAVLDLPEIGETRALVGVLRGLRAAHAASASTTRRRFCALSGTAA